MEREYPDSYMQSTSSIITRTTAIISIVVIATFILILHFMGRIPYCECGIGLWTVSGWASSTSQHFGDPYSFSHVLHGFLFFWFLLLFRKKLAMEWRFVIAMLIEIAWEIWENSSFIIDRYREATAALGYTGDSILNSTGDVIFCMLGFWFASRFGWKITLALLIVIELVMLALMKDNLTLNILMLVYPVEAIKEWQLIQ